MTSEDKAARSWHVNAVFDVELMTGTRIRCCLMPNLRRMGERKLIDALVCGKARISNFYAFKFDENGQDASVNDMNGDAHEASANVALDCRAKRMRQEFKSRLQCYKCPGRTLHVGVCAHVEFVMVIILLGTNAATNKYMNAIGMYVDCKVFVLSDSEEADEDDASAPMSTLPSRLDAFTSIVHSNMFLCKT